MSSVKSSQHFLYILNWANPGNTWTLWSTGASLRLYYSLSCAWPRQGQATSTHCPGCQIFILPPMPSYMRHCRPVGQSQADTDRLLKKNRSTREAAHIFENQSHMTCSCCTPSFFCYSRIFVLSWFSSQLQLQWEFTNLQWSSDFPSNSNCIFSLLCVLRTSANMCLLTAALLLFLLGEYFVFSD